MSLYKLIQFVLKFIKSWQLGFYFYDNFSNMLHCTIIERVNRENKNSVGSGNKSKKTMIKSYTAYILLNKLGY